MLIALSSPLALAALLAATPVAPPTAKLTATPPATPVTRSAPKAAPALATGSAPLSASILAALRADAQPSFDLPLPGGGSLRLHLEPVDILTPDAQIVAAARDASGVHTTPVVCSIKAFAVRVEGRTDASGVITLADDAANSTAGGTIGGFVRLPERTIWLSNGPRGRNLPAVSFDPSMADPSLVPTGTDFCQVDLLAQPEPPATGGVAGGSPNACREVALAIDTDWEYTASVFGGNTAAAAAYALALTAATSEIYTNDLNVRLRVNYLRLWTGTNAASDPWDQTSTTNQLFQYRDYWVANEGAVTRDLGHFISGRGLGGGVAWLPGLCGGDFAFGLSANMNGSFPYPIVDNSGANWDIMVYAHEIGHNFGSPHTHSYDPPLDGCGNGDCSAANTGTIMSYCHTCAGGLGNIALHFHPANVVTMTDFLDTNGCDFTGPAEPTSAMDDYVTAGAGSTANADVLFNDLRVNCETVSIASFDATTVHGATVTLNPGPSGGRPSFSIALPTTAIDDDSFTYTITDTLGSTDTATVFIDVLPLLPATPVVGTTPKIDVDYYVLSAPSVLPDFTQLTPYLSAIATQVNFVSTGGDFASSGRADEVGAVFEGWLNVPTSGFYTLFVESDDGSRLLVDGTPVVNNDGLHGMVEKSGVVGLLAGKHVLRVEFFESGGGAGVIARWQGPGISKQVIPAANLSRGGTIVGPDLDGNGAVDASDLALLLGAWGSADPAKDLDGDGTVNAADLAILLGAWG
jgi:hypothetical protein